MMDILKTNNEKYIIIVFIVVLCLLKTDVVISQNRNSQKNPNRIDINGDGIVDFIIEVSSRATMDEPTSSIHTYLCLKALNSNKIVGDRFYTYNEIISCHIFNNSKNSTAAIASKIYSQGDKTELNNKWISSTDSTKYLPLLLKINGMNYYCAIRLSVSIINNKISFAIREYGFLDITGDYVVIGKFL